MLVNSQSKQTTLNKNLHMDAEIFRKLEGFSNTFFAASVRDKANTDQCFSPAGVPSILTPITV